MTLRSLGLAGSIVLLASCANPPPRGDLIARNSVDLCEAYHIYAKESPDSAEAASIRQEIMRRGEVPEGEWAAIDRGEVLIGMSQCGALAAWGTPQANNQTITATGQTIQLVYGKRSVYTNGKVVTD